MDNILNILRQTSVNAVIAVGMTFVILIAGIDLSVGSVLALTSAIAASMVDCWMPIILVIVATFAFRNALGRCQLGIIVAKAKFKRLFSTFGDYDVIAWRDYGLCDSR